MAIESPTHSLVDAALRSLPIILPVLDFSTIKNEFFPVIASVFSKTSSLGIKVRGLEAFVNLCGGSSDPAANSDGLNGIMDTKKTSSSVLDKYTMQDKIVPLVRAIKTKEPAVGMAALNVLKRVGEVADGDFVALQVLPILWSMGLGPLLNLQQFQAFMGVIKSLSSRVESEQLRKLQEMGTDSTRLNANEDFVTFGGSSAFASSNGGADNAEIDFERLVKGTARNGNSANPMDAWDTGPANASQSIVQQSKPSTASFSWSTPSPTTATNPMSSMGALRQQTGPTSRTITPDLSSYTAMTPTTTQYSQPLQPQNNFSQPLQPQSSFMQLLQPQSSFSQPLQPQSSFTQSSFTQPAANTSINWGANTSNPWNNTSTPLMSPSLSSLASMNNAMSNMSMNQMQNSRPTMSTNTHSGFSLPPPPAQNAFQSSPRPNLAFGSTGHVKPPNQQKTGLDAFESLL